MPIRCQRRNDHLIRTKTLPDRCCRQHHSRRAHKVVDPAPAVAASSRDEEQQEAAPAMSGRRNATGSVSIRTKENAPCHSTHEEQDGRGATNIDVRSSTRANRGGPVGDTTRRPNSTLANRRASRPLDRDVVEGQRPPRLRSEAIPSETQLVDRRRRRMSGTRRRGGAEVRRGGCPRGRQGAARQGEQDCGRRERIGATPRRAPRRTEGVSVASCSNIEWSAQPDLPGCHRPMTLAMAPDRG